VESLGYKIPEKLTWDFLWEVSQAAMEKNEDGTYKINGQKVLIPFIYKSTDNMMIQYLKQAGAGYSTDEGDILIFNDTTKEFLYDIAENVKAGAFSTFKISSYPGNYFNAGQCIFAIDSTAGATWIGSNSPLSDIAEENKVDFETVVMEIPQVDTENPRMISQGPSVCVFNKSDPQEVLASWLFTQFLLTNEVQISYSQTEGYVPVTSKAQQSEEYKDYLSRRGEDNDMYYYVKLDAAKLLIDNVDNTFITPVFNGSASLRNAAGQLIENTAKSTRRNETVDEAYIANLYKDVTSLYRLDQTANSSIEKQDFGKMPVMAMALISTLSVIWICIGIYQGVTVVKNRKK
jgi:multiple sugar transport system substrate-binding protein